MVVLETERLFLREWVPDDWVRFKPLVVDPRVIQYINQGGPWQDERIEQRVGEYIEYGRTRGWHLWPVIHRADAKLIGFCGFSDGFPPDVEIGWRLLPDYWGRGLATEVAKATLDYGFRTWNFPRVISVAQTPNRASIRVMQKIGMSFDGTFDDGGAEVVRYVAPNPRNSSPIAVQTDRDPINDIAPLEPMIDVSHTVEDGLITYKGLPAPVVCDFLSREASRKHYAEDTEFHIGKIEIVANTGTYVDSPFHRFAKGRDLSELPLSSLADLPAVVVRANARRIDASAFDGRDVAGKAVLVETGWSKHWKTEAYFEGHPFLTEDAAIWLRDQGAALVGIDSLNIDDTNDGRRPVHTTLLAADIPIVEHLTNLASLPATGSRFFAVPVKVKAFGTFPVRAFAEVRNSSTVPKASPAIHRAL